MNCFKFFCNRVEKKYADSSLPLQQQWHVRLSIPSSTSISTVKKCRNGSQKKYLGAKIEKTCPIKSSITSPSWQYRKGSKPHTEYAKVLLSGYSQIALTILVGRLWRLRHMKAPNSTIHSQQTFGCQRRAKDSQTWGSVRTRMPPRGRILSRRWRKKTQAEK